MYLKISIKSAYLLGTLQKVLQKTICKVYFPRNWLLQKKWLLVIFSGPSIAIHHYINIVFWFWKGGAFVLRTHPFSEFWYIWNVWTGPFARGSPQFYLFHKRPVVEFLCCSNLTWIQSALYIVLLAIEHIFCVLKGKGLADGWWWGAILLCKPWWRHFWTAL